MNFFEMWTTQANARKDAKVGVDSCDDFVGSVLGERPVFNPSLPDHAKMDADLKLDTTGHEAELQRLEDEVTQHPSRLLTGWGLAGCYAAEALACVSLMKSLGFQNPEKTVIGLMFAACVFWLTTKAAEATGRGRYFVYVVYAALVLAVAAARWAQMSDPSAVGWAGAVVMMLATVGPAWLAEKLWKLRLPVAQLAKQIRNVRRRLSEMKQRRENAQRFVDRLTEAQRRWDNDATIIRSTYRKEHRRRTAQVGVAWPGPVLR